MSTITMTIEGMTCGHCVGAVTRALTAIDGVRVDQVVIGSAVVTFDPAKVAPDVILKTVADEGYAATTAR